MTQLGNFPTTFAEQRLHDALRAPLPNNSRLSVPTPPPRGTRGKPFFGLALNWFGSNEDEKEMGEAKRTRRKTLDEQNTQVRGMLIHSAAQLTDIMIGNGSDPLTAKELDAIALLQVRITKTLDLLRGYVGEQPVHTEDEVNEYTKAIALLTEELNVAIHSNGKGEVGERVVDQLGRVGVVVPVSFMDKLAKVFAHQAQVTVGNNKTMAQSWSDLTLQIYNGTFKYPEQKETAK